MTVHQQNVFQLAENLGMTVAVLLRDMPMSEFFGWMQFYNEKAADAEREAGGKPKLPPKGSDLVMTGFGI